MLQTMRRQDEIVGLVLYAVKSGGLAQELAARRPGGVEVKLAAVAQAGLPGGLRGEVDVVDAGGGRVDRKDFSFKEDTAGSAYFQSRAVGGGGHNVGA